jgi:hypothetical protein
MPAQGELSCSNSRNTATWSGVRTSLDGERLRLLKAGKRAETARKSPWSQDQVELVLAAVVGAPAVAQVCARAPDTSV